MADERLVAILGKIGQGISAHEAGIRKKLGLSEAEYKGFFCISEEEKITCQEFAKRMDLSVSRGSRVIDRLCTKKYIERVDCEADRRCKNIWLTKKGKTIHQIIANETRKLEEILTAGYPGAKLVLLKSDLKRLYGRLWM